MLRQLVTLVEETAVSNPELLSDLESEFPYEMAAIEACDEGMIPDFQIETMITFIESEALLQLV